jgi:antitoxin (DNA-binding transcriptional repressor) of toxin-antitoxin stability system
MMYTSHMQLTATDLRKDLFRVLDRAMQGEAVEIVYKGSKLRLTPQTGESRLARAVRRHALLVPPQSIIESDAELMGELEKKWNQDDKEL